MNHRVIPLHCADFPENLAYEVGEDFGREYKTWLQGGGRDRGAKARVGFQLFKRGIQSSPFSGSSVGGHVARSHGQRS